MNIKANHDARQEVSIWRWFGLTISEKTFLAVANTMLLNSLLFLGEIVQLIIGMRDTDYDEFSLLNFKNLFLVSLIY